jgi:hypothetical protein
MVNPDIETQLHSEAEKWIPRLERLFYRSAIKAGMKESDAKLWAENEAGYLLNAVLQNSRGGLARATDRVIEDIVAEEIHSALERKSFTMPRKVEIAQDRFTRAKEIRALRSEAQRLGVRFYASQKTRELDRLKENARKVQGGSIRTVGRYRKKRP